MFSYTKKIIALPIDLFTLFILWVVLFFVKMNSFVYFISREKRK